MSTKPVIFDVDDTLIDTNGLHTAAWVEAFQHFGVEVDLDHVPRQMGKGGDQLMPSLLSPDRIEQKGPELDAEAARAAGLRIVGVLCGGFDADALHSAGCTAVY